MKIRPKSPALKSLIVELTERGHKEKVPAWIAIARALNRPKRTQKKVNLWKIERYGRKGETIVVPGCVLGAGRLTKPVRVVAVKFSASARKGILAANGSCFDIAELIKIGPKGIRIMA